MDLKFKTMKKLFITAATALLFSATAFATTVSTYTGEENVTYTALNHFAADFKGAKNPAWVVTSNCQKVSFTLEGAHLTAFYSLGGEFMGTTQDLTITAIPAEAKKTIATKYAAYTAGQVIKYDNFDSDTYTSTVVYFVDLKKTGSEVLVKVTPEGDVSYFKTIK